MTRPRLTKGSRLLALASLPGNPFQVPPLHLLTDDWLHGFWMTHRRLAGAAHRFELKFIDAVEQRRGKAEADPMRRVWSQIRDQVLAHPE